MVNPEPLNTHQKELTNDPDASIFGEVAQNMVELKLRNSEKLLLVPMLTHQFFKATDRDPINGQQRKQQLSAPDGVKANYELLHLAIRQELVVSNSSQVPNCFEPDFPVEFRY